MIQITSSRPTEDLLSKYQKTNPSEENVKLTL